MIRKSSGLFWAALLLIPAISASAAVIPPPQFCIRVLTPHFLKRAAVGDAVERLRGLFSLLQVRSSNVTTQAVEVENLIDDVILQLSPTELQSEVQKIMDRYNQVSIFNHSESHYLPGLTPQTNVTRVEDFVKNYTAAMAEHPPGLVSIASFYGNITPLVIHYRMMIDANEDVELNFKPWCEALTDARIVRELLDRLSRGDYQPKI